MNWDAVIAVTEVIGVIAIIGSLVYVGKQIRQSASLARAAIVHETSVAWTNASAMLATDAELTDIFLRGVAGEALSPVETKRLESLIDVYMTNLEDIDHQYQSDLYFDEEDTTDAVDYLAPLHKDLMLSPVGRNWWATVAPTLHTPSFFEKMNRIIKNWEAGDTE
jgi:hypothetical protein